MAGKRYRRKYRKSSLRSPYGVRSDGTPIILPNDEREKFIKAFPLPEGAEEAVDEGLRKGGLDVDEMTKPNEK